MTSQRLTSLDAFRGLTMALMVVVNTPGNGDDCYAPLKHAEWHGWTITDTVFPSFLWIVGVAITLSLGKCLSDDRAKLIRGILRRAAILFVLGLLLYAPPHFDLGTQRILGVLQRIAICYLIASVIFLYTSVRGQILWAAGFMAVYWLLMFFVPVPGFGAGRLDVEGNFAHYIDRLVLGSHNYIWTKTWDPEGLVSTLPAIASTLLGILAGQILRRNESLAERMTRLLVIGNLLIAAGLILDIWMPINKKLWTDSFALFMGGLDFVVFAISLYFVDYLGFTKPVRPLVILGMNAIAIYLTSEFGDLLLHMIHWGKLTVAEAIYQSVFVPLASPANASLLYSLTFLGCNFAVAYVLYRRGWFLRV